MVNGSNFQIEQQCPQCGAPIIIDETDRILSCKFCRTRVYLVTEDHFRFYIPPAEGIPETIYFIPYWRLKGLSYTLEETNIAYKYFDANFLSFDLSSLPYSLGLRPQTMKFKFVGGNGGMGKFIASSYNRREALLNNFRTHTSRPHQQEIFIGEATSVIYTPVYCANGCVHDAVLKTPLYPKIEDAKIGPALASAPVEKWQIKFIPLLCPNCGADLPGEKDALIVFCPNCNSAWNPSNKDFAKVKFSIWREERGYYLSSLLADESKS